MARSRLLNLRIFRKRAETTTAFSSNLEVRKNSAFPEDKIKSELITEWKPGVANSKIRTVDLITSDKRFKTPYMYHFTGHDPETARITSGLYFYELELEILDGSVEFVEDVFSQIINLQEQLQEYYILANQHNPSAGTNNYNINTQRFIPEFSEFVHEKLPSMADELSRKLALVDYIYALSLFYSQKSRLKSESQLDHFTKQYSALLDSMVKITNPANGSPEGIKIVLELVEDLTINIERALTSLISGPTKKAPAVANTAQGPTGRFTDATRTYKITHCFDDLEEVFDSCVPKNLGVDYVRANENFYINPGLAGITMDDFNKRVSDEVAKFNRGSTIRSAVAAGHHKGPWEEATTSLKKYFPSDVYPLARTYFTPEEILMIDDRYHLSEGISNNLMFYNGIFTNLLRYDEHLNMEGAPFTIGRPGSEVLTLSLPIKEQKFRNNLLDLFSSFGCIVEDMKSFVVPESEPSEHAPGIEVEEDIIPYEPSQEEIIEEQNAPSRDLTKPQVTLFRILKEKIQSGGTELKTYRLLNDSGQYRSQGTEVNLSVSRFKHLPPQLRALMAFFTQTVLIRQGVGVQGSTKTKTISNLLFPKPENQATLVPSIDSFGGTYLNFLDIMEMQYLFGYEKSIPKNTQDEERVFMKSPLFTKMHSFPFEKIDPEPVPLPTGAGPPKSSTAEPYGTVGLCRIQRYVDKKFHGNFNMVNFPIYNEYFLIGRTPEVVLNPEVMQQRSEVILQAVKLPELPEVIPFAQKQIQESSTQQSLNTVMKTVASKAAVVGDLKAQMDASAMAVGHAMAKKAKTKKNLVQMMQKLLDKSATNIHTSLVATIPGFDFAAAKASMPVIAQGATGRTRVLSALGSQSQTSSVIKAVGAGLGNIKPVIKETYNMVFDNQKCKYFQERIHWHLAKEYGAQSGPMPLVKLYDADWKAIFARAQSYMKVYTMKDCSNFKLLESNIPVHIGMSAKEQEKAKLEAQANKQQWKICMDWVKSKNTHSKHARQHFGNPKTLLLMLKAIIDEECGAS